MVGGKEAGASMRRNGRRIGAEFAVLALVLGCVAGTIALVIVAHRRLATPADDTRPPALVAPRVLAQPARPPRTPPAEVAPPAPQPEDRSAETLAALVQQQADAEAKSRAADDQTRERDSLAARALAEARTWKANERATRKRASDLADQARALEEQADEWALQRDALAERREKERLDLQRAQARSRDSLAALPYQGTNGTWRLPIAIECTDGAAILQPGGARFETSELDSGTLSRGHPLIAATLRAISRIDRDDSPDGARVVPYVLFVVRPDGIRAYYEARARLEALGIAFGYELVEQGQTIEYPDPDDPNYWGLARAPEQPLKPFDSGSGGAASPRPLAIDGAGDGDYSLEELRRGPQLRRRSNSNSTTTARGANISEAGPNRGMLGRPNAPRREDQFGPGGTRDSNQAPGWGRLTQPRGSSLGELSDDWDPSDRFTDSGRADAPTDGSVELFPRGGARTNQIPRFEPTPGTRNSPGTSDLVRLGDPVEDASAKRNGSGRGDSPQTPTPSASPTHNAREKPLAAAPRGERRQEPQSPIALPPAMNAAQSASPGMRNVDPRDLAGISPPVPIPSFEMGAPPRAGSAGGDASASNDALDARTFEITVTCRKDGAVINPSGKRISLKEMKTKESALRNGIQEAYLARWKSQPEVGWRPRIKFLIEPDAQATFMMAKRQTVFSGVEWPTTFHLLESASPEMVQRWKELR